MLDFCVFGAGRIGKVHAPNIAAHPKARLRYIVDPDLDAGRALAEPLGAEPLASGEAALADDTIGAVLICGPTTTHIEQTEAAARAGKAIFCEKPIGLDIERVEQCIAVVTEAGVPFLPRIPVAVRSLLPGGPRRSAHLHDRATSNRCS